MAKPSGLSISNEMVIKSELIKDEPQHSGSR